MTATYTQPTLRDAMENEFQMSLEKISKNHKPLFNLYLKANAIATDMENTFTQNWMKENKVSGMDEVTQNLPLLIGFTTYLNGKMNEEVTVLMDEIRMLTNRD